MKKKTLVILCSVLGILMILGVVVGLGVTMPVAPEADATGENVIVAEIYFGDSDRPYKQIKRSDFSNDFGYAGDNIFKNDSYLQSANVRIELLDNINVGGTPLAVYVGADKTVEFNGNGYTINGDVSGAPIMRVLSQSNGGKVVINNLNMDNTLASCLQPSFGVTLDFNKCYLKGARQVIYLADSCTLNINSGTVLDGMYAVFAPTSKVNTVNVNRGSSLHGSTAAILISQGSEFTLNVNGGIVKATNETANSIIVQKSVGNVYVNVDNGYLYGNFDAISYADIHLNSGKLVGAINADAADLTTGENFIIEPFESEVA